MGHRYAAPVGKTEQLLAEQTKHGALNYLATEICYFNMPDKTIIT